MFMNLVHILNIGSNIHIFLIDNAIYKNVLLNMTIVDKVSINIDFQENKVVSLLYGTLQLNTASQKQNCNEFTDFISGDISG